MELGAQIVWLFVLAIPVACVAWTFTHEEIFREARDYCARRSRTCARLYQRKLFYTVTCEYCFSHYVTIFFVGITRYQLLLRGWRGYLIAVFSVVWLANLYMGILSRLRLDLKSQRIDIAVQEKELDEDQSPERT